MLGGVVVCCVIMMICVARRRDVRLYVCMGMVQGRVVI